MKPLMFSTIEWVLKISEGRGYIVVIREGYQDSRNTLTQTWFPGLVFHAHDGDDMVMGCNLRSQVILMGTWTVHILKLSGTEKFLSWLGRVCHALKHAFAAWTGINDAFGVLGIGLLHPTSHWATVTSIFGHDFLISPDEIKWIHMISHR